MPDLSAVPNVDAPQHLDEPDARASKSPRRIKKAKAAAAPPPQQPLPAPTPPRWDEFARMASIDEIERRFSSEAKAIIASEPSVAERYACLAIFEPFESIGQFELDQVFAGLRQQNAASDKDVLLFLLSPGGNIEPAYQISKLCKTAAKNTFAVCIPRQAKSAATLIALGADEIHMGLLGHLGPIDPQVSGLPALGVSQALETLATLVEKYPASSPMFSKYLQGVVKIEQIGYYDRICASAVQYAERLLAGKTKLPKPPGEIAREFVHEYKDHGFVIDLDEAIEHLGSDLIRLATTEVSVAERLYRLFEMVNLYIGSYRSKRLWVAGSFDGGVFIFDRPNRY